jgi:hypothetical protein
VRAENPAALRFILQDDIYLLQSDKVAVPQVPATTVADAVEPAPAPENATLTPSLATTAPPIAIPPAATPAIVQEPTATATIIVTPSIPQITATETPAARFNYMGGNKKNFLIITHYTIEEHIATDHLAALQSILKRLAYEIDDVAILNLAKATITTVTDIVAYFKPEKLLILGEAAVPAGMGVPPVNQYKKMKNGTFLRSFSFDEMMSSTDNKKVFWEQMKNL